jgi:GNAT superfamily N-acetyltransferase
MTTTFRPLDARTWPDLERLFGARGACGGCWCMAWRLPAKEFQKNKGEPNRNALRAIAESGAPAGVLAYIDGEPVGWCAVAPREIYRRLEKSRVLRPVDNRPVWSVSCLFIAKPYRRRGLSSALLRAAAQYAAERGATLVEGYPTAPAQKLPDVFVWTGTLAAFERAGFRECARRSPSRPIVRLEVA